MKQDELKLVLEALKWCHGGEPCGTAEAIAVVEKALAQQEPWCMKMNGCKTKCEDCPDEPPDICCEQYDTCLKPCTPRGVHLAQRTWVGLTDDEIEVLFQTAAGADEEVHIRFARAIESKLKEVNT
jgi:hypothetical protein